MKVEPCQPTWQQHTSATTTSTGKPTPGSSLEHISGSRWPSNYDPGASDRPQVSLFWLVRNGTFSLFLPGWPGATLSCTRRPRVTLTAARRPTATLTAARRPIVTLSSGDLRDGLQSTLLRSRRNTPLWYVSPHKGLFFAKHPSVGPTPALQARSWPMVTLASARRRPPPAPKRGRLPQGRCG